VQKAKWNTFTFAAAFISAHAEAIDAARAEVGGSSSGAIDDHDDPVAALKPFRTFIEAVEGDQATLASAYASLQQLYQRWEAMRPNEAAALRKRFETTVDGVLMDLAFALSKAGHAKYAAKVVSHDVFDPLTAGPQEEAIQQAFVSRFNAACDKFVEIAKSMYSEEAEALGEEFDRYISTPEFRSGGHNTRLGWSLRRTDATWRRNFVNLAQLITELPASEAIAERFFSVLTAVFAARREGSAMDLIQGSMIRMWEIYHREEFDFVTTAPRGNL
jgi:hypothetical protein